MSIRTPRDDSTAAEADAWRLCASFLIFLHLFAVVVASLASARAASGTVLLLDERLAGPYAQFLNVGNYSFHLTHALDRDFDHTCDVLLNWRRGIDDSLEAPPDVSRLALFEPDGVLPKHRKRRYQNLALVATMRANSGDASATLLPRAIVRSLLAENNVRDGEHRFRCRMTTAPRPPWSEAPSPSTTTNVYRANVIFDRGFAELVEVAPEAQVAPVDRRRGSKQPVEPRLIPPPGTKKLPPANPDGNRG